MLLSTLFVKQIKLPQIHFLNVHCKISHALMHNCLLNINTARESHYVAIMSTVQDLSAQKGKKKSEGVRWFITYSITESFEDMMFNASYITEVKTVNAHKKYLFFIINYKVQNYY